MNAYHVTQQIKGDEVVLHSAADFMDAANWAHDYVVARHAARSPIELSISNRARIVALVTFERGTVKVPNRGVQS